MLADPPPELSAYYPDEYYAFREATPARPASVVTKAARCTLMQAAFVSPATARAAVGAAIRLGFTVRPWVELFGHLPVSRRLRILDVGCGSGHLLRTLERFGFEDLTGVDAHLPERLVTRDGTRPRLIRGTLGDLAGSYDLVMFHHSLEHTENPVEVLNAARRILSPAGAIIVRVPLAQTFAWRTYGVCWVQLDVPRHQFVPSERGFRILAARSNLAISDVLFDSDAFQFWGSELHVRGIPFAVNGYVDAPADVFSRDELANFDRTARRLNAEADGDQAAFLLTPTPTGS